MALFCHDSTNEMQAFLCFRCSKICIFTHLIVPLHKFCSNYSITIKFDIMENIESCKGEIVMYQPDETIRLEVREWVKIPCG